MKILTKKKSKGKNSAKVFSTACQDYSPDMREYVFAIRGRPFAMLSSEKLPVPPVSLMDYNLVRDLGLEMHDLQCTKYTFGGRKLRILGRISQSLQTIQDGSIAGTAHVRANVVENLYQAFDTHSVAGQQMITSLTSARPEDTAAPPTPTSPRSTASGESGSTPTSGNSAPVVSGAKSPSVIRPSSSSSTAPGDVNVRSKPPLSSPKPLNKHHLTTWRIPQPREDLCPGIPRRTIPTRPDSSHFYGRVVAVRDQLRGSKPTGQKIVEVDYGDNGEVWTANPVAPYFLARGLRVNDAVLFKQYEQLGEAMKDGHENNTPIMVIYSKEEEAQLTSRGAYFPDCPPEMLPDGYYG